MKSAVLEMLGELNRKGQRGADAKTLAYYAESLSGFDETAVRRACDEINGERVDRYRPWPDLEFFKGLCRKHSPRIDTAWTLERYREAWYIDRYISEQIAIGRRREDVLDDINERFPSMGPMWAAWRNQTDAGTIQIPAGWCGRCDGRRNIATMFRGKRAVGPCPACQRTA